MTVFTTHINGRAICRRCNKEARVPWNCQVDDEAPHRFAESNKATLKKAHQAVGFDFAGPISEGQAQPLLCSKCQEKLK